MKISSTTLGLDLSASDVIPLDNIGGNGAEAFLGVLVPLAFDILPRVAFGVVLQLKNELKTLDRLALFDMAVCPSVRIAGNPTTETLPAGVTTSRSRDGDA